MIFLLAWQLSVSFVWAEPTDIYGFGARSMGRGSGGIAVQNGSEGWWLNPATAYGKTEFMLGYAALRSSFTRPDPVAWDTDRSGSIDASDEPYQPPWDYPRADGVMLGFTHQVDPRLYFGANLFLPVDRFLQIHSYDPALPVWIQYRTRPYRYAAHIGMGSQLLAGLHVGAGAQIGYRGHYLIEATVKADFTSTENSDEELADLSAELNIDQTYLEVVSEISPLLGVHWDVGKTFGALDGLHLGAIYRRNSGKPIIADVEVQANVKAQGLGSLDPIGLGLLAPFSLSILDYYIPDRWGLGVNWDRWDKLQGYVDVSRTYWSRSRLQVANTTGEAEIPLLFSEPTNLDDGNNYNIVLNDIWELKMGLQTFFQIQKVKLEPRFGVAYQPSIIADVGRNISTIDAPRSTVSLGLGVKHSISRFAKYLQWDVFGQYHYFTPGKLLVLYDSPQTAGAPQNANSTVPIEGSLAAGGLQLSWGY